MDPGTDAPYLEVPTSCVPFVETEHGRLRRKQRGIDMKDLQRARKRGQSRPWPWKHNGCPTTGYTYKDITYIVNDYTDEEVTSYAVPLKLDLVPVSADMRENHKRAYIKVQDDLDMWTSNTVLVVDTSGSMGKSDMWGTRTRLGAVWVSIALDFIAHRIETGAACFTDIVSVVTLGDTTQVLIEEEPCTWVLYNKIAAIYNTDKILPRGHGPFLPSLEAAEQLLTRNSNASYAMGLIFLSDGVPSDCHLGRGYTKEDWIDFIVGKVEDLAKQFGRRLAFMAIGIGDCDDFSVLQRMVDAASDYGAISELRIPSMTSSSLGEVFTVVAKSITTTQSEMTNVSTNKQQKVRQVMRESRKKASQTMTVVSEDDFFIYAADKVKRTVYKEWFEGRVKKAAFERSPLQHPDAKYVAMSKGPFGEGAERFAYRFFELSKDRKTIVGRPMVAKESRLIIEEGFEFDERARKKFVRTFCSTQQLARRIAGEFNEKLCQTHRADPKTPRVTFLDCSIYRLDDMHLGKLSVLVEEKLDHNKWFKWNANNGYVEGMKGSPEFTEDTLRAAMMDLATVDLDMVEEGSEDEEEPDEDHGTESVPHPRQVLFTPSQVAQAFSHFSYLATDRKRLVCDLQGVYDEKENVLKLSDPAIHFHDQQRMARHFVHGTTDRGRKGTAMFFDTHKDHCAYLCRLMNRGFKKRHRGKEGDSAKSSG